MFNMPSIAVMKSGGSTVWNILPCSDTLKAIDIDKKLIQIINKLPLILLMNMELTFRLDEYRSHRELKVRRQTLWQEAAISV